MIGNSMPIIVATIDTDNCKIPFNELIELIGEFKYYVEAEPWSNHIRDMRKGWEKVGNVKTWTSNDGPFVPGTYALVYDKDGDITNPLLCNRTMIIGETTQDAWKRLAHQVGGLRGSITNTSDKWQRAIPKINKRFSCDLQKNLDKVIIWFRPHAVTDKEHQYDRKHSSFMETQAHAQYHAIWGYGTPANTRDLPSYQLIKESRAFLVKHKQKVYSNL